MTTAQSPTPDSASASVLPDDAAPPAPLSPPSEDAAPPADVATDAEDAHLTSAPPPPAQPAVKVLDTSTGRRDGLNRCPKCGSTEVKHVAGTDELMCQYCRTTWTGTSMEELHGLGEGIAELSGRVVGLGAAEITDSSDLITLKCIGCGAEVVINTATNLREACHWCRQQLTLNNQVPNGAVPDGILPFSLTREQAMEKITEFASKRRFYADDQFKESFKPENVMGVFLPYMVVDGNVRSRLDGIGEVLKRRYTIDKTTYYDASVYRVYREFDMAIDDLIVESSSQRADMDPRMNTNNIINAVLPFDVKNMVAFDANFMGDFTSERRDLNIDEVSHRVNDKFMTIAREKSRGFTTHYNRGVRWESEQVQVRGTRWVGVYLPVWLYSHYQRDKAGKVMVHYVAVNARTGATMGSIPYKKGKLLGISIALGSITTVIASVIALALL